MRLDKIFTFFDDKLHVQASICVVVYFVSLKRGTKKIIMNSLKKDNKTIISDDAQKA